MQKTAILIPCYNEEQTIQKVITDWHNALPDAAIYVYDNNSTDGTAECAQKTFNALGLSGIRWGGVFHESQQGKGNVVRTMFREIDALCYILVDGDDTYSAKDAQALENEILNNHVDMVIGDRLSSSYFTENKRPFHNVGNTIVRAAINRLFKSHIQDVMTGLRAFSFEFVKTFPILSKGFEIETEMTCHALDKNLHIKNRVIEYKDRPQGSVSKLNTIPDGIKVLKTIFTLYKNYRPLPFFGFVSLALTILSAVFFIPIFIEYLQTALVRKFPTLIVCGFVIIAALLSLFSGLILDMIAQKERQNFEFRITIINQKKRELLK